jgi:hypothetical protein
MPSINHVRHQRRRGLERVSRLTGWLAGAALVASAAFAALLARPQSSTARPASTPAPTPTAPTASAPTPTDPGLSDPSAPATSTPTYSPPTLTPTPRLRPSHRAPQSSSSQGVVSSGAS